MGVNTPKEFRWALRYLDVEEIERIAARIYNEAFMGEPNWDSITETALYIHYWAQRTFPGRNPNASLSKLVLEEIPELLAHKKKDGINNIGAELADCFILLMDL